MSVPWRLVQLVWRSPPACIYQSVLWFLVTAQLTPVLGAPPPPRHPTSVLAPTCCHDSPQLRGLGQCLQKLRIGGPWLEFDPQISFIFAKMFLKVWHNVQNLKIRRFITNSENSVFVQTNRSGPLDTSSQGLDCGSGLGRACPFYLP